MRKALYDGEWMPWPRAYWCWLRDFPAWYELLAIIGIFVLVSQIASGL